MLRQSVKRMAYASTKTHIANDRDYYGTPPEYIQLARKTMGNIELDPASSKEANDCFVKANRIWTVQDDGLAQSWLSQTIWMNPPYSSRGAYEFARKFAEECELGHINQSVVLVNSATGTRAFRYLLDNSDAICFCNKRIQFIDPSGKRSQTSNSKEQLFFYRGGRVKTFARQFGTIGRVLSTKVL